MDTTTLTLPKDLMDTVDEIARRHGRSHADVVRTAIEVYAERTAPGLDVNGVEVVRHEVARPETADAEDDGGTPAEPGEHHFASLGVGESTPSDGYDSTNIKDWIRRTWRPDKRWATE